MSGTGTFRLATALLIHIKWDVIGNVLFVLVLIIIACSSLYVVWKVPKAYISSRRAELQAKDELELENDYRATLAQIVAGFLVLMGLFFTLKQMQQTQRTLELTQRGQGAERFEKAIEHLGKQDILNKTGGIFALETLAENDPDNYGRTVANTLAAYVRRYATLHGEKPESKTEPDQNSQAPTPLPTPSSTPTPAQQPQETPADIQEVLTFLGRYLGEQKDLFQGGGGTLNLSSAVLRNADMRNGNFEGVDFRGINAFLADFTGAFLASANFQSEVNPPYSPAYLKCAKFNGAHLKNTRFNGAVLHGAFFIGADLEETVFNNAELNGARFQGADLSKAHINQAQINQSWIDEKTILPPGIQRTQEALAQKDIKCAQ